MVLALEMAAVFAQIPKQLAALHATVNVSRRASSGKPRRASSSRSSRINFTAPAKVTLASSDV
jgi:hypothetical protein